MKTSKLLLLGMLALTLGLALPMATPAYAQLFHGATIQKIGGTAKVGDATNSLIATSYNDDYGDTISILEAWDIVDPGGAATRVPATGNLEIVAVFGNTTATVGGSLPALIGPGGSTLSGLPGDPEDGEVWFIQDTYIVQPGDPDPLPDEAHVIVEDLGDDPDTVNPPEGPFEQTFGGTTNLFQPSITIDKTGVPDVSKPGDDVTYTVVITNTSSSDSPTLIIDSINDTLQGDLTNPANYDSSDYDGDLDPGETCTIVYTYTVQPGDPDPLSNTASVETHPDGFTNDIDASDGYSVDLVAPAFTVTKVCLNSPIPPEGPALFEITITNTGDVDLIITTDEPDFPGPFPLPQGGPPFVETVARQGPFPPLEDVCNTINVTATLPPDLNLPNVYTMEATGCCSVVPPEPQIDVTKEVDCEVSKEGDEVVYTICIKNTGPTRVYPTSIDDTKLGDLLLAFEAGCFGGSRVPLYLESGEDCCLTSPWVLPAGPDPYPNTVTFEAEDEFQQAAEPAIAQVSVNLVHPELTVTKSCTSENQQVEPGGVALFEITVENTGDVCLDVVIVDLDVPGLECGPFTLAPGQIETCPVEIDVPEDTTAEEIINRIEATWTICESDGRSEEPPCLLNEETVPAQASCEVGGGATRTPGFWKTHTALAEHVLEVHVPGCGDVDADGCINLGWIKVCTIEEFCAVMWANKANNTDGSKRSKLCQARMHASFHALAAILNDCVPSGGGMPVSAEEIATTLGGTNIPAIRALASELAEYNESGDDVMLNDPDAPMGSATPQECKGYDQSFADCINGPTAVGKGKGNNK